MEPQHIDFAIGAAAIAYGAFTFWARAKKPQSMRKLEPMKKMWGARAGYTMHVVGYSVLPIGVGISFLLKAAAVGVP